MVKVCLGYGIKTTVRNRSCFSFIARNVVGNSHIVSLNHTVVALKNTQLLSLKTGFVYFFLAPLLAHIQSLNTLTCLSSEDIREMGIINYFFFNSAFIVSELSAVAFN